MHRLADETATQAFASRLAAAMQEPLTFLLSGNLGAGKTSFVRAMLRQMGFAEAVQSPTYLLRLDYETPRGLLIHADAYRLKKPEDFLSLDIMPHYGLDIVCIEWPERIEGFWPEEYLQLIFTHQPDNSRSVSCRATGRRAEKLLAACA